MSFYNPVDGMPYVINDDGEKISLDGSINAACGNSGDSSGTSTSEGPEGSNVGEGKWKQDVETDNKSKKISTYTNAKGQNIIYIIKAVMVHQLGQIQDVVKHHQLS